MKSRCFYLLLLFAAFGIIGSEAKGQAVATVIDPGAYIIDMGLTPTSTPALTVANGLEPYGLTYDLVKNHNVLVRWAIDSTKTFEGTDFSVDGRDFKGGPLIITADQINPTILGVFASWPNVEVYGPTINPFIAPVYAEITSFPRILADIDNFGITDDYFDLAGIPLTVRDVGDPTALNDCYDIFLLPHSDPTYLNYRPLLDFNFNREGYIFGGCHAVSVLENLDDPMDLFSLPDLNFLTDNGLVRFDAPGHDNGSGIPTYPRAYPNDPIMQFMGHIDESTEGGSEQVFIPELGSSWRPTTKIAVWDTAHSDLLVNGGTLSNGEAVKLAYGPGFGDYKNGLVMYEGGHSLNSGTTESKVAAVRAFLNFTLLKTGLDKKVKVENEVSAYVYSGVGSEVHASAENGVAPYTFDWASSCGGTFGDTAAATTTFTPPSVPNNTPCLITVTVSDQCGEAVYQLINVMINPDFDEDGLHNRFDIDDDNDGILDVTECYGINPDGDHDGDQVPNFEDHQYVHPVLGPFVDDNNDGVADWADIDGDGQPNHLDLDADGDAVPDGIEANNGLIHPNMAANGQFPSAYAIANDADGDGWVSDVDPSEGGTELDDLDADGDGLKNWNDLDSDGDGITDAVEANAGVLPLDMTGSGTYIIDTMLVKDVNSDGLCQYVDINDGGTALTYTNTDGDDYGNGYDIDADNDGIVDIIEAQTVAGYAGPSGSDTDGDGLDDQWDPDNGGSPMVLVNTDGTDSPDYVDLDSDNDMVPDVIEGQDANMDGAGDYSLLSVDLDKDGLDDGFDPDYGSGCAWSHLGQPGNGGCMPLQNTDGTDNPDWRDTDDDNDTTITGDVTIGAGSGEDYNANGDWADDYTQGGSPTTPDYLVIDADEDGIVDGIDIDDDNDGIPDVIEMGGNPYLDTDGDGIYDQFDLDADGDGIADAIEGNHGTPPAGFNSATGMISGPVGANGMPDAVETAPESGTSTYVLLDNDGDGILNHQDLDSDGDGTPDVLEAGLTDTNNDGVMDPGTGDANMDGIDDSMLPVTYIPLPDGDTDGIPDYLDIDSDNDGIVDHIEMFSTSGLVMISGIDDDNDGIDDAMDVDMGGTIPPGNDNDGDGVPDHLDLDSDNDAVSDLIEGHDANTDGIADAAFSGIDADMDGLDDAWDPDFIGCSYGHLSQPSNGGCASIQNTDGLDELDFRDTDDDNDGVITGDNGIGAGSGEDYDVSGDWSDDFTQGGLAVIIPDYLIIDSDSDSVYDPIDIDDDNDGIPDLVEQQGDPNRDTDGDGRPDHLDIDADNDGIPDAIEGNGGTLPTGYNAANGRISGAVGPNGMPDLAETFTESGVSRYSLPNSDGTGERDFQDIDADDDGIVDNIEGQTTAGYVSPSGIDANIDGLDDAYLPTAGAPTDTDGDGIADYIDTDSDNDTVLDLIEGHDFNPDGIPVATPSGSDLDGDGLDDAFDPDFTPCSFGGILGQPANGGCAPVQNTDLTGDRDWRDLDDDDDLIVTADETLDASGNGIPDYLEVDTICGTGSVWLTIEGGIQSYCCLTGGGTLTDGDSLLGLSDTAYAELTSTGMITVDLGEIIPGTQAVEFRMRSDKNDLQVMSSLDGISFGSPMLLSNDDSFVGEFHFYDAPTDFRYLRIRAFGDMEIDAVRFVIQRCFDDNDNDNIRDEDDLDDDNDGVLDIVENGGLYPDDDTDGDNVADFLDPDFVHPLYGSCTDTDLDGECEFSVWDNDQDGIPNHYDIDSDNDGVGDGIEANNGILPPNMNNNGYYPPSYAVFNDTNENGVVDIVDAALGGTPPPYADSDGDGLVDGFDIDADNDGIVDLVEAQTTAGLTAPINADIDGDGMDDAFDFISGATGIVPLDFDGDGIPDYLDDDTDNDGVPDWIEGHDADMNGIADIAFLTVDFDNDGLDNAYDLIIAWAFGNAAASNAPLQNTDGLGDKDWRDIDDDGDGIPTISEDFNLNLDWSDDFTQGGLVNPDYLFFNPDNDNDTIPNAVDIDDDNDGILDIDEGNGVDPGADADGDGLPNYLDPDFIHPIDGVFVDSNGDGVNDVFDTDGDGIPNHYDLDSDNDGIPDLVEAGGPDLDGDGIVDGFIDLDLDGWDDGIAASPLSNPDSDGDGIVDIIDLDSDNDGIADILEAGGTDTDGDGMVDSPSDLDGDGFADFIDSDAGGTPLANDDTDGDGVPNTIDIDADNDGIVDIQEGQSTAGYIPPSLSDVDGDGIDDAYDIDFGGTPIGNIDTDGDGIMDFMDPDADGDGVPDSIEGHDVDANGIADVLPTGTDSDGDGLDDAYDITAGPSPENPVGSNAPTQNTDGVDELDFRDTDDENDGIPTIGEDFNGNANWADDFTQGGSPSPDYLVPTPDHDNDGIPDYIDIDDDNDGVPDLVENQGVDASLDADADGTPNYQDPDYVHPTLGGYVDVNGDGTNDIFDVDMDGLADHIDLDSDNDGIPDVVEAGGADADNDGIIDGFTDLNNDGMDDATFASPLPTADTDGDGLLDLYDLDSDHDGIADILEAGGTDANGDGVVDVFFDFNGSGLSDIFEPSLGGTALANPDTDGDGFSNYLDIDSDDDGIVDLIEALPTWEFIASSNFDTDGDGIDDQFDTDCDSCGFILGTPIDPIDTDMDGTPDYLDADSDNDGVSDLIEGNDADGDGVADFSMAGTDSDGDGLDDAYDVLAAPGVGNEVYSSAPMQNTDGLDDKDWRDVDDDNDGINTAFEIPDVSPANGIPDYLEVNNECGPGLTPGVSLSGNADVAVDVDDVSDEAFAEGAPDLNGAKVKGIIELDLTDIIPHWEVVTLSLSSKKIGGQAIIESSLDGVTWGDASLYTASVKTPAYENVDYVVNNPLGIRYIRITKVSQDIYVDAASYNFQQCEPDSDQDGIADGIDIDDDNDGILDVDEAGGIDPNADADSDGVYDYLDPDFIHPIYGSCTDGDADGTCETSTWDYDGDGIANHLDLDTDNDGITDAVEANDGVLPVNMTSDGQYPPTYVGSNDGDNDGWADDVDPDNSGTPLPNSDMDGDGLTNVFDLDSDGDGITDPWEAGGFDINGDGILDFWSDADGDGLDDTYDSDYFGSGISNFDTDGDGIPNYLDIDSDGDGIPDNIEGQNTTSYVAPSGIDADGNGIDDAYDTSSIIPYNTDGTDRPDYTDTDSDNDGVPDIIEGNDVNSDGVADVPMSGLDSDGDGLDDALDTFVGPGFENAYGTGATMQNTDGTDQPDWRDLDDDNDGIPTGSEDNNSNGNWADDFAQGGVTIPDYLYPPDHDNDGIPDPTDIDDDNDGILDIFETIADMDVDGIPNLWDLDSDNDGIPDIVETGSPDIDNDGMVDSFVDTDNDGLHDPYDPTIIGGVLVIPGDNDDDALDNYLDLDSDNDGIADVGEVMGVDISGDGTHDGYVDVNNNGWIDLVDGDVGGTALTVGDFDADGLVDYLDIDSDNDGITDNVESQSTPSYFPPLGTDTDGDGFDDAYDTDNGGTRIQPVDTDLDGIEDCFDLDSDDDGVWDYIEGHDADANGIADTLALGTDADGDGLDDAYDIMDISNPLNATGSNAPLQNTDGVDDKDWRDTDDDNDGLLTINEDFNLNLDWSDDFTQGGPGGSPDYLTFGVLSIELLSFDARLEGSDVKVEWTTETEIDNDYFVVERSWDHSSFVAFDTVDAVGNSSSEEQYGTWDYSHQLDIRKVAYYRLKQVDENGAFSYSEVKAVHLNIESGAEVSGIYPNPASSYTNVEFIIPENGSIRLDLINMNGQFVTTLMDKQDLSAGAYKERLELSGIAAGTYLVKVIAGNRTLKTHKLIITN